MDKMKQHITEKQLNELSKKGKKILKDWYWKKLSVVEQLVENSSYLEGIEYDKPLLSIGQMIEFLQEKQKTGFYEIAFTYQRSIQKLRFIHYKFKEFDKTYNQELCDALWKAVKEVLNGQTNQTSN